MSKSYKKRDKFGEYAIRQPSGYVVHYTKWSRTDYDEPDDELAPAPKIKPPSEKKISLNKLMEMTQRLDDAKADKEKKLAKDKKKKIDLNDIFGLD